MSKRRCDTGISIYKMSECVSDIRNARHRAAASGALAREVDEAGGVGVAGGAGTAGPLGSSSRQLRVIWTTLRPHLVREAEQEDQQEDQRIQTPAAEAHARGV